MRFCRAGAPIACNRRLSQLAPTQFRVAIDWIRLARFDGQCKGAKVGPRSARVREVRRAPQARDWPLTLVSKPR